MGERVLGWREGGMRTFLHRRNDWDVWGFGERGRGDGWMVGGLIGSGRCGGGENFLRWLS